MQTTLNLDEAVVTEVHSYYGNASLDSIVQTALQELLIRHKQDAVRALRGKLSWEGDLDAMRTDYVRKA
jgi:Arc/MetJ family transcription regulator